LVTALLHKSGIATFGKAMPFFVQAGLWFFRNCTAVNTCGMRACSSGASRGDAVLDVVQCRNEELALRLAGPLAAA